MTLINFEFIKLRKKFQLEVSSNSTFSQLPKLVFSYFNLNENDYPDDKNYKLVFIYKSVLCRYERTIESYNIESQSKVYIYVPKQIYQIFSNAINSQNHRTEKNISSTTNHFSQQLHPDPNSNANYLKVLSAVNQNQVKQLVELGYNEVDAVYALGYKIIIEGAIDFINIGLASDPTIRSYIEKIVSAKLSNDTDNVLRYSIEIIKIEAGKKGEIVEVSVAAAMGIFASHTKIKDPQYVKEIKDYIAKVNQKYPGMAAKAYLANGGNRNISEFYQNLNEMKQLYSQNQGQNFNQFYGQNQGQSFNQFYGQNQGQNFNQFYGQNQGQNFNQFFGQNQGQEFNPYFMISQKFTQTKDKFFSIFNSLPTMNPQNYKNPFIETQSDLSSYSHSNFDDFYYEYGKKLNYEQLMFLYRMLYEKGIGLNISLEYLSASGGNIKDAEELTNSH